MKGWFGLVRRQTFMADAAHFREWRRQLPLHPLASLETEPAKDPAFYLRVAQRIIDDGWQCGTYTIAPLEPPVEWMPPARSPAFHLQAWDPLAMLLAAHGVSGQRHFLTRALELALDWIANAAGAETVSAARSLQGQGFAWYDMAVGLRVYRLGYLLDAAAREDDVTDQQIDTLLKSFHLHLGVLSHDDFLAAHNNHGFYQAWGQLAAAWRFREDDAMVPHYRQALRRVVKMHDQQFFSDGVQREHSPGYHLMTLSTLKNAAASGLLEDGTALERVRAAESAFAWFVLPNGNIAAIGDTDPWLLAPNSHAKRGFTDRGLQWALSGGTEGQPTTRGAKVFPDAGYFVVRAPVGDETSAPLDAYFLHHAGFHSRTHKHADHGTFLWYDAGCEILVDAGRYYYSQRTEKGSEAFEQGFWYADPGRMYAESTRAHNCVEIDGRDYLRKGARPFGSALRRSGNGNGLYWVESEFYHFRNVRHARTLVFRPGHFVLVYDWLSCGQKTSHTFDQWFHLHPAFDIEPGNDGSTLTARHFGQQVPLTIAPLLEGTSLSTPLKGAKEPRMQGWFSDKANSLVENWAVAVRAEGTTATFATILSLSPFVNYAADANRVNVSGRKARFAWDDDRGRHSLSLERPPLGDISCHLTTEGPQ